MPERSYFRSLLDKCHEINYIIPDNCSDQYLRDILEDLMNSIELMEKDADKYSSLSWYSTVREEDKPFSAFLSCYKR